MKNISVIMARGIEGCGVTKYTVEQVKWLKANGYNVKTFASKDKSFSRKNAHVLEDVSVFKFSDDALLENMIKESNESDLIIINSLPAKGNGRGKGAGDKALSNWTKALKSFKKPVVLIQHDHTVYSIKRNGALEEAINAADLIFVHSTQNDFAKYVRETVGNTGLSSFFEEIQEKTILSFQPGIDFDGTREKYWKPIEEQDSMHHKWIGRTTSWKGYQLMFAWHNEFLAPNNCLTTFEGIEKSPAWLSFKEVSPFFEEMGGNAIEEVDLSDRYGKNASVFSTFVNDALMHRMSRVGFGYQLSILKPKYIERSIEYTHQEVIAAGAVPVFRKEYGEACIHRVTGDPLIHSKGNNTLWLGAENGAEVIEQVKKLTEDPSYRDAYREGAYEFYKNHQDASNTFNDLMKAIKENL